MTPAPAPAILVPTSLPDLRALPFGELASPATLEAVLQRVLPGTRHRPATGRGFSSAL